MEGPRPGQKPMTITKKFLLSLGRVEVQDLDVIPLAAAYLCTDCFCLSATDGHWHCAGCGSSSLLALQRVIPCHQDQARLLCRSHEPDSSFYRPKP